MRFFNFIQRTFKRRRRLTVASHSILLPPATPDVADISFEIQTPTLTFAPYVLAPPVVNFDFLVSSLSRTLIVDVVDLVFDIPSPTTYYPILLLPTSVDLVFTIHDFSKIIVPVAVDLAVEVQAAYTTVYAITPTVVDLEFIVETDISTFFTGYFFCVDEGLITAPGCWEGRILDGITAIGKINCGD